MKLDTSLSDRSERRVAETQQCPRGARVVFKVATGRHANAGESHFPFDSLLKAKADRSAWEAHTNTKFSEDSAGQVARPAGMGVDRGRLPFKGSFSDGYTDWKELGSQDNTTFLSCIFTKAHSDGVCLTGRTGPLL